MTIGVWGSHFVFEGVGLDHCWSVSSICSRSYIWGTCDKVCFLVSDASPELRPARPLKLDPIEVHAWV